MAHVGRMPTVHIVSDGNPEHTRITGPDGVEIRHVKSFAVMAEAGEMIAVELTISPVRLDVDGPVTKVILECPFCKYAMEHGCGGGRGTWAMK